MTLSDMKLGKLYPKDDPKTLQLASYLRPRLIAPPKDIRWGKPLPAKGLGMMRNDELGDCTCAAAGHMIVGDPNNDSDSEVGSWGGHAISIQASIPWWGYTCITWGEKKGMTFNFWKTYVDECYAILDSDWINAQGISPNGLDFETLQEDLKQVTS